MTEEVNTKIQTLFEELQKYKDDIKTNKIIDELLQTTPNNAND